MHIYWNFWNTIGTMIAEGGLLIHFIVIASFVATWAIGTLMAGGRDDV